ncbi:MAG: PAS domain S-box protein [Thermoflexales bacterium]|nr:PAS domain S-box protein [Thermoflexales bacterium]
MKIDKYLVAGLSLAGLYLTSLYSYPLFHTLAELLSIAVALSVFMLAWNSREYADNDYVLFVGISLLFVGFIALAHTLAYRGVNLFAGYDTDLPTQLWIAERYLQSLSLLAASRLLGRKPSHKRWLYPVLGGYGVITLILFALIFARLFPACYIEGQGLTPFKIYSEYLICLILLAALGLLLRARQQLDPHVARLLAWSIVAMVGAEVSFTQYVSVYGPANMVGHLFQVVSVYLVYEAVVVTGIRQPYNLAFRNLKQSEQALQDSQARLDTILNSTQQSFVLVDRSGYIQAFNRVATSNVLGFWGAEMHAGDSIRRFVLERDAQEFEADFKRVLEGEVITREKLFTSQSGQAYWLLVSYYPVLAESGQVTAICINTADITERKQIENVLTFLAQSGSPTHGEDFFQMLARYLAENLSMDYVCIDRLEGDLKAARTVAVYYDGQFEDNVSYTLQDTPCGDVVGRTVCSFPAGVRHKFPRDAVLQEMLAESYMGVTLWGYTGQPIGLIAVIGRRWLENPQLAESLLEVVAVRAAGELERQQAEETLRESERRARQLAEENAELLREVNHRVGNNLHLLLILVDMALEGVSAEETRNALLDLQGRVRSMADVHKLLSGAHWAPLDLARLAHQVIHGALATSPIRSQIQCRVIPPAEPVHVRAKQAFKLALILNELTTNSIKYAFKDRSEGQVEASFEAGPWVRFEFRDDGPGWPDDVLSGQRQNVGLELVKTMVCSDMEGRVALRNDGGAVLDCAFKIDP